MSKGDNSPGISKLAGLIGNMIDAKKDKNLILDYGIIQDDYTIITHDYPLPIKPKDYMICRHLRPVPDEDQWETKGAGSHTHAENDCTSAGFHTHKFQPHEVLDKGDHVLVAWVQNDPIVIDVIIHGNELFR